MRKQDIIIGENYKTSVSSRFIGYPITTEVITVRKRPTLDL